uniref:Transposase n=1 Tax=Toxocara canis TaxID=6265 RepID=A0A183V3J5_TOXCA
LQTKQPYHCWQRSVYSDSAQTAFWNLIKAISGIKAGNIIFCDGDKSHALVQSNISPNRIRIDESRTRIFVASPNAQKLTVYKIVKDYRSVELVFAVDLYTSPDNVHIDDTGIVLRVAFKPDFKTWAISEPYANDGSELVASTVAVSYYQQLPVGTIYRTLHRDIAHSAVLKTMLI